MIPFLLFVCWEIAVVFGVILFALTRNDPSEVRRVTNALVVQRAKLLITEEKLS